MHLRRLRRGRGAGDRVARRRRRSVVTNPNAVNASNFIFADDRVVYTEGYALNLFATGVVPLYRPAIQPCRRHHRAGRRRRPRRGLQRHHGPAVYGLGIVDYVVTDEPIGTSACAGESGAYGGRSSGLDVLPPDAGWSPGYGPGGHDERGPAGRRVLPHFLGAHPNPVGGAEAVVSHLLTRALGVPTAHAPMINFKDLSRHRRGRRPGRRRVRLDQGLAASSPDCAGLSTAPFGCGAIEPIGVADVVAVAAPATALGSARRCCPRCSGNTGDRRPRQRHHPGRHRRRDGRGSVIEAGQLPGRERRRARIAQRDQPESLADR